MSERFWTVVGYDKGRKIFERDIAVDDIAESAVKTLLQRLAARGLTEDEVVLASLEDADSGPLAVTQLDGDAFGFATAPVAGVNYVATLGERADLGGERNTYYAPALD